VQRRVVDHRRARHQGAEGDGLQGRSQLVGELGQGRQHVAEPLGQQVALKGPERPILTRGVGQGPGGLAGARDERVFQYIVPPFKGWRSQGSSLGTAILS